LVVKPNAGQDTAQIFSDRHLKRDTEAATISDFVANEAGFGRNDLQDVAKRLCEGVGQALDWLSSLGLNGRMTGSGSAVFALVPKGFVPPPSTAFKVKLCSSLDIHPLAGWV
jgi:4-diphosphocytidyl-2-C-methyl-D-erythritol kinase